MTVLNSRIVRVGIQIEQDFQLFEGLDIRCTGQHFAAAESSACKIQISNLTRDQKNFILTRASPLGLSKSRRSPVLVTLDVGRAGVNGFEPFRLFQGYCWASGVTMPPDIGIILESTTNNAQASTLQPFDYGQAASLRSIATFISLYYGLNLNFTATDKMIANFHYTGGLQDALNKLRLCGLIRVQLTGLLLKVYDIGKYAGKVPPFTLSTSTGMVSIPEVTENGVKVSMLIRPEPQIGGPITIQSQVNPAVNNIPLYISTMNFHVTSRDDPFWYELYCSNQSLNQG